MRPITITVNGRVITEAVQPRTHLADFLRERLDLTGTHLRCEQGACGACTLLIDGQPARSCITYAAMCEGADVRTIEGLRDDPIMQSLHRAFSEEHGLQCGFCTPGMLVTARDIVIRLPDATLDRVRLELTGNLCRCTGYVGIVNAISRVLEERRLAGVTAPEREFGAAGPVGAHAPATPGIEITRPSASKTDERAESFALIGLNGRKPTLELNNSFKLGQSVDEVWSFFQNPIQVVACLPGASATAAGGENEFDGLMSVRLGPIAARFSGRARITRDDANRTGLIVGSGKDVAGGSLASGELRYIVRGSEGGGTVVDLNTRILLVGSLAQFARAGIVDEIVGKLIERFAVNVDGCLSGTRVIDRRGEDLRAGSLLLAAILRRIKRLFRSSSA